MKKILKHAALAVGLTLFAALPATVKAAEHNYYVTVDGRPTLTSGTYAGQANPNSGRLTLLYAHWNDDTPSSNHFHGIGVYSLNHHAFDVLLAAALAAVGYLFYKLGCELVPLLIGFVSGPILEQHLRQALAYSHGDWGVFVSRPVSAGALAASALLIAIALFPSVNRLREQVFKKFPSP